MEWEGWAGQSHFSRERLSNMRRRSGGFVTRPLAEWSHRLPKADSHQNAIALDRWGMAAAPP